MTFRVFILGLIFSHFTATGQFVNKGLLSVSGAAGMLKPSTFSGDLNNHPLMLNFKAGYFFKRKLLIGFDFQSTAYSEQVSGIGRLQQPGSNYTEAGTIRDKFISVGIFSDFYAQINRKLFFVPGAFVHYLHGSYTDKGEYYSNGIPIGISYSRGTDFGYSARAGANLTMCYVFNTQYAISLRCVEFEIRLRRKANDTFIAAPLMIGIQYHFNLKK